MKAINIFKFILWLNFALQSFNSLLFAMADDDINFGMRTLIVVVSAGFLALLEKK